MRMGQVSSGLKIGHSLADSSLMCLCPSRITRRLQAARHAQTLVSCSLVPRDPMSQSWTWSDTCRQLKESTFLIESTHEKETKRMKTVKKPRSERPETKSKRRLHAVSMVWVSQALSCLQRSCQAPSIPLAVPSLSHQQHNEQHAEKQSSAQRPPEQPVADMQPS